MPATIEFDPAIKMPLYLQIAGSLRKQIESGALAKHELLPSINAVSEKYKVARDTIGRAYKELVRQNYVESVGGKGYYVSETAEAVIRILLIFNKLSSYKRQVYKSFLQTLGSKGVVDLQLHHYNPLILREIIDKNLGKYDYYVIMPHFLLSATEAAYMDIIRKIPVNELVILDKNIPSIKDSIAVFQDFRKDIYDALISASDLLGKYTGLCLVFPPTSNHPKEIIDGLREYCNEYDKEFVIAPDAAAIILVAGWVYISVTEHELVTLIKKIRVSDLYLGINIGVISFNETELKELLDITVISTDFEQMGTIAASLVLNNRVEQVRNPVKLIRRSSL